MAKRNAGPFLSPFGRLLTVGAASALILLGVFFWG